MRGPDAGGAEPRIHIAVPVFNNRATVRAVVEGVLAYGLPVIVVDDGSTDGSGECLDGLELQRITHEHNLGKGAALVSAARAVREAGDTHLICFDADGQFDTADIEDFIEAVRGDPQSIVYGVRAFVDGDAPGSSVFGRKFSNFWARVTTGKKIRDSQCGFRAYPIQVLLDLGVKSTRYDFEVDTLVRGVWAGCTPVAVPISVTYSPPGGRVSHFRPFMDNARISRSYSRLFFRAMMPIPHSVMHAEGAGGEGRMLSPWHPIRFLKSLLMEKSTARELAAASALGLFVGTLPIFGLHMVSVVFAASLLRLNRLLAFSVSHLCAPPLVPALCMEVGFFMRNGQWLSTFNAETLWAQLHERLLDYVLGTVVVAPLLAAAGWLVTYGLASIASRSAADEGDEVAEPPSQSVTAKYGSRLGIKFFHLAVRVVGLRGAYFFLWFAVPYYVLFRPSLRKRTQPYIRRRFPDYGRLRRLWATTMWVMEFSRGMIDQAAVRARGHRLFDFEVPEVDSLTPLLSDDRGVILLMTHVGSWRIAIPALEITDKPVGLLLFHDPSEPTAQRQEAREMLGNARIIDPSGAFGGLIEATSLLSEGQIVSIMGDRMWGGRAIEVEFLGDRAWMPESPYRLARSTGARLLVVLVSRVGHRRLCVHYHEIEEISSAEAGREAIARQAQAYASVVEDFLRDNPYSWSNFFDIWRPPQPRAGAETAASTPLNAD